jgi:hypothetical protein
MKSGIVDHIVLVRLKAGTTEKQIDALTNELLELKNKISGIVDIAAGVNNSPEGLDKGNNFGLFVRFKDVASRDAYLSDSAHGAVVREYGQILDDLTVVDFEH